jgi:hypothetical protein
LKKIEVNVNYHLMKRLGEKIDDFQCCWTCVMNLQRSSNQAPIKRARGCTFHGNYQDGPYILRFNE